MSQDGEQLSRRERLDVPSTSRLERRLLVGDVQPQIPKGKPAIKPLPQSGLLGHLQTFLPTLEAANVGLKQQLEAGLPHSEVAMERGSDDEREGPYVEMDLACGLFELKDASAVAAAEQSLAGQGVPVELYGGSSSDSDSDSNIDNDSGGSGRGEEVEVGAPATNGHPPPASAAAAATVGGSEAMQQDAAAPPRGAVAAEGADAAAMAAGPPERQGKKGGKRHAGIEELS